VYRLSYHWVVWGGSLLLHGIQKTIGGCASQRARKIPQVIHIAGWRIDEGGGGVKENPVMVFSILY
jgi:hypothetical protein